jgi:CheY-like chemotaxis protein
MTAGTADHRRRILIVDDDVDIRETLQELLEDRGFEVATAASGAEALWLLRAGRIRPSLILLDLMMPVLDGYGFLAEQRRDPTLAAVPVAVLSASHAIDLQRVGDGVPILRKPMSLHALLAAVDELSATSVAP